MALRYVLADAQPTAEELANVKIDQFSSWQRSMRDFFPVQAAGGWWILTMPEVFSAEELQYWGYHFPPAIRIFFPHRPLSDLLLRHRPGFLSATCQEHRDWIGMVLL